MVLLGSNKQYIASKVGKLALKDLLESNIGARWAYHVTPKQKEKTLKYWFIKNKVYSFWSNNEREYTIQAKSYSGRGLTENPMVKNNGLCRDLSELLDGQGGHKLQINSEMVTKILSKRGIPMAQTGFIVFRVIWVTHYAETEELAQCFCLPPRVMTEVKHRRVPSQSHACKGYWNWMKQAGTWFLFAFLKVVPKSGDSIKQDRYY